MRTIRKLPQAKTKCKWADCGVNGTTYMTPAVEIGQELRPYAGGGDFGYCWKCKRPGMIIIEVPVEVPTLPVGWSRIPGE